MIRNTAAIAGTRIRHGSCNLLHRAIKEAHFEETEQIITKDIPRSHFTTAETLDEVLLSLES